MTSSAGEESDSKLAFAASGFKSGPEKASKIDDFRASG
jgi:hypothetical protein